MIDFKKLNARRKAFKNLESNESCEFACSELAGYMKSGIVEEIFNFAFNAGVTFGRENPLPQSEEELKELF